MHAALVHRDLHEVTRGGICTVYRSLADELTDRGHRVTLLTQATPHPVRQDGIDVVELPRTDDTDDHRRAVADALTNLAPDVVECSTWEAETLAYLDRQDRAPVLVRGDLPAATMGIPAMGRDERTLCARADGVVAVSRFAADALAREYGIDRPELLANGVDRDRFTPHGPHRPTSGWRVHLDRAGQVTSRRPLVNVLATDPVWGGYFTNPPPSHAPSPSPVSSPARPVRLAWVGKFTEMKGFDRLTTLIPHLAGTAQFVVVLGHGQIHYPVPAWHPDHVLICQDLDDEDVPVVYRAADYLLTTSRWEGYGLAIAEALACGTPALLPADLAVGPELIAPGSTGATWDGPEELLGLLADRPPLVGALPERYSWSANADATLGVYRRLIARRGQP